MPLTINITSFGYAVISLFIIVMFFSENGYSSEHQPALQNTPAERADTLQNREDLRKASDMINQYINRDGEQILLDIISNDRPGQDKALFLLGRLYKEEKSFERAEIYLLKAYDAYPLLGDYALSLLLDVYLAAERYEKVIETAPLIKSSLLFQHAKKSVISSLLMLSRDREAISALSEYITMFPRDWESRLTLATLLTIEGELNKSISLYKDIYLSAVPLSEKALHALKVLESDVFSREETLQRADNLFSHYSYRSAERTYSELLKTPGDDEEKDKLIHSIAMCQFKTKRYEESAKSFSLIDTPEAMFWQARSFYRTDSYEAFSNSMTALEKRYPDDKHIPRLLLMEAEEFQRRGKPISAAANYMEVIRRFPRKAENAFWGMGWMHYVNRDYDTALTYFTKLAVYKQSKNFYKYLFWEAKTREKISLQCLRLKEKQTTHDTDISCDSDVAEIFHGLPSDESYYGYMIKLRTSLASPDKIKPVKPDMPENETNKRIEALYSLGMKDDAADEVAFALKKADSKEDMLYLGFMAMSLGKYKVAIYHAEPKDEKEFLPYSYPLAYWDNIKKAAESGPVDAYLVAALIREESRFDPKAVSWAGAIGLMQVMPSTAKRITGEAGVSINSAKDLFDPEKNILIGTQYLAGLINEFNALPIAIMSYNAGENRVTTWLEKYFNDDIDEFIENVPYKETRRYVKKVLKSYWQYRTINGLPVSISRIEG